MDRPQDPEGVWAGAAGSPGPGGGAHGGNEVKQSSKDWHMHTQADTRTRTHSPTHTHTRMPTCHPHTHMHTLHLTPWPLSPSKGTGAMWETGRPHSNPESTTEDPGPACLPSEEWTPPSPPRPAANTALAPRKRYPASKHRVA